MSQDSIYQLVQASHVEMAQRWRHHYHAWGSGIPLELYLRREEALNDGELCRKAMRMWLLKNDCDEILASCETYAARIWYGQAEGDLNGLKLETVASVLVEPRLRGQGYAGELLKQLSERLKFEEVAGVALYSDVGPGLYRRAGSFLHPARESIRVVTGEPWPDAADEITLAHVADLLKEETRHVHPRLAMTSVPSIVEVPTAERIEWFNVRSQFRAWSRGQQPPVVVGARGPDGGYVLWTADAPEAALHALVWRPRSPADAAVLAQAALAQAGEQDLQKVIWWDADRDTGLDPFRAPELQPPGAMARDRESSLPMLAWLDDSRPFPLVWAGIERFGWS